jgi:hypothetical protein
MGSANIMIARNNLDQAYRISITRNLPPGWIVISALFVLFVFVNLIFAADIRYAEVVARQAPVTKVPSKSAPKAGSATQGQKYLVLLETNEWVRIRFQSIEGWVPRSMVRITTPFADGKPAAASPGPRAESPAPANPAAASIRSQVTAADTPKNAQPASIESTQASAKQEPLPAEPVQPRPQPAMSALQRLFRPEPAPDLAPVQIRRVPKVIILPDGNRIIENVEIPETLFVRIIKPMIPVYDTLDPQSPILGNAKKGQVFPVIKSTESWHLIAFKDSTGWVEKRYTETVSQNTAGLTSSELRVLLLFCGGGFILVIIVVFIFIFSRVKKSAKPTLQKSVLIIAAKEKQVVYAMTNHASTLGKCFSEIGFNVSRETTLLEAQNSISHIIPDVILVDWQLQPGVHKNIDMILSDRPSSMNILVIFYNFPDPSAPKPQLRFQNVHYLGLSFTDRELFNLVTPIIITGEKSKAIQTSVQSSALEGDITEGSLSAFFQFIEMGRKTGCLLVRDKEPYGMVFFEGGRITYADCKEHTSQAALVDLLNMKSGRFRFLADKVTDNKNCNISTMEILMEWAKTQDEAHSNRLRQT